MQRCAEWNVSMNSTIMRCFKWQDYYGEKKSLVDYGKFYNTSYLSEGRSNYLKKVNSFPRQDHKSPHFHRPLNFSYSKDKPEFLKTKKSKFWGSL